MRVQTPKTVRMGQWLRVSALCLGSCFYIACASEPDRGTEIKLEPVQTSTELDEFSGNAANSVECPETWKPTLVGHFVLVDYPGKDDVGPNGERPIGMSKEYTFESSTYEMIGYPPLKITGHYEILEVDGVRMKVRFTKTNVDGSMTADHDRWIEFSRCGDQMKMEKMSYIRVKK